MTRKKPEISIARVYDAPAADDRYRVLIDRIWPRGVKKADLDLDEWLKEAAPSSELRRWFNHDPDRWEEFQRRYVKELKAEPAAWSELLETARKQPVLLLYGARDEQHNNAVALKAFLEKQ